MSAFTDWRDQVTAQVRFKPDRQVIAVELTAHYEDHVRDLERLDYPPELAKQRPWQPWRPRAYRQGPGSST